MKKTLGFATTSGQDYEVFLCCLLFVRALRLTSGDFFLVSNHGQAGKFDDVILFYRLQGDKYRAILLQAKHRENVTRKKLTSSYPFRLKEYLESFKVVRRLVEQPVNVEGRFIEIQEFCLVLYTNTGCEVDEAAAVDVTDFPEVQPLRDFVNTGGRLLRISEVRRLGLTGEGGDETSDFLAHLILCTDQMSVDTADGILEEELCKVMKLTSRDIASKLTSELKRVVRSWWREETARYLTSDSEEWCKVLEIEIRRLNGDTLIIDKQLNLKFSESSLVVHRRVKNSWISVRDEYQANAVRSRLLRAQRNSLVIGVKSLEDHLEEVEVLWGSVICSTLVLDMTRGSPEEASSLLRRLQESVVHHGDTGGRRLVVIARGNPTSAAGCWSQVDAEPTWSVLQQVSRDRLLATPVRLQGETVVTLRDVLGGRDPSIASDVMTDHVISSVCACETEIRLGAAMAAPLGYILPRCLQRTSSRTVHLDTLANTNMLIFPTNDFEVQNEFRNRFKILKMYEVSRMAAVKHPTVVKGITYDYDIRKLCYRLRVRGLSGAISLKGSQGDVTEFLPFTWICEEKVVIVEGPPGVGKSSLVTMMCSAAKEQFPEAWVLRVDMGRHTEYIKETDLTQVSHIQEFLIKGLLKDATNLERRFLERSLGVTGNVFLFLDAFDEISPDYTSRCCDLLRGVAQKIRYRQMVVTTRPVTTNNVEEALQTKAFTLPVYSGDEQVLFLKKFSTSRGNAIGEEGISSLRQNVGPALEIPLLCRMAAEVFMHSRGEQLLLKCQNPWRRVLLYKLFVEQMVTDRHAEKFGMEVSIPGVRKLLDYSSKLHLQNLQGLAVRKLIAADQQLPPLSVSTEAPEEKLGLVVNQGGRVDFEHQTFAEYFLGCWLACHWRQCPLQLLRDVSFRDGFQFVAATFSWSLFDGYPLHLAVAQGDEDAVRKHLSPPAGTTTDRGGRSALHVAAMTECGRREVWELLVASGGEDLDRKDDVLGATAVEYAEMFRNWEFVDLGLEKGSVVTDLKVVSVQVAAKEVLIYAVKKDLACLCQFIWRRHSDILPNVHLLHLAAANNSKRVLKLLLDMLQKIQEFNQSRDNPLQEASRRGHVEAVRLLVDRGADVNVQVEDGNTALMEAAVQGHLEVVQILLESGANVNVKSKRNLTALILASREDHVDVVKVLLGKGADANIKTNQGNTALTWAAWKGLLEVVKILLESGADVNMQTEHGLTALMEAAREDHLDVVKVLLRKGANVNLMDEDGSTALTYAAWTGHLEVVKELVEKGADVNIKTEDGHTALNYAAWKGHLEVVKELVENGADVDIKNKDGHTALSLASHQGHLEVVKVLEEGFDNRP